MTWLYTALYEGKYIDKDSSSDLWDLKSTEISFLGTTYETKDKINIDEWLMYHYLPFILIQRQRNLENLQE